jgi:hypothetical protein
MDRGSERKIITSFTVLREPRLIRVGSHGGPAAPVNKLAAGFPQIKKKVFCPCAGHHPFILLSYVQRQQQRRELRVESHYVYSF